MTKEAVDALGQMHGEIKRLMHEVTAEQWSMPSACEGWRVQDVLAHMSSNMKEAVDPTEPSPDAPPPPEKAEEMVAAMVTARDDWTPQQLLVEYDTYVDGWIAGLSAMQEEPIASTVGPLADLGEYPMHMVANAFAFDHYCHLWIDLLGPDGPLESSTSEPPHEMMRPGIDWMIAGLPRMQPTEMAATITQPLRLELTGPGGGSWLLAPASDGGLVSADEVDGAAVATISSSAHDFVSWGTQRSSWRDHCAIDGDASAAEAFLDALNII